MSDGGKGDTQRPTDWEKFNANFDAIFGRKDAGKSKDHAHAEGEKAGSDSRADRQADNDK
jgi:hypothetical protein